MTRELNDAGAVMCDDDDVKTAAVAESWSLIRLGVEAVLRRSGVRVVASTSTGAELLRTATHVDLVVIGDLPDMSQCDAVTDVRTRLGAAPIVLACGLSPDTVVKLFSQGAMAVVARGDGDDDLAVAVQSALQRRRHVTADVLGAMFDRPVPRRANHLGLTTREVEVLVELASGLSNKDISKRLLIGIETVKTHVSHIYDKLDVRTRAQAARVAIESGLV